jgi:hypothetical protein
MDWSFNPKTAIFSLMVGICAAKVWLIPSGYWCGSVTVANQTTAGPRCLTREHAQAWCEAQLAALAAAGRCVTRYFVFDRWEHLLAFMIQHLE